MSHTRYSKVHHLFLFFFNIESCGWIGAIAKKLSMEKMKVFVPFPTELTLSLSSSLLNPSLSYTFTQSRKPFFCCSNLLNKCGLITVNSKKTESLQNIEIFLVVKPVSSVDSCNVLLIYFFL